MDLAHAIVRMQRRLQEGGAPESEASAAFGPATPEELTYLSDLYGTFASRNAVYTEAELDDLRSERVSPVVLEFYRLYEPKSLPMFDCYVRLLGLEAILQENSTLAPGSYLIRHGLIVFAATAGGHAICMDLNQLNGDEPRVVLFDHTWCSYDDEQRVVKCISIPAAIRREYRAAGKPLTLSYELINRCAPEIAPTFSEFLRKLADGEYEDVEKFLRY